MRGEGGYSIGSQASRLFGLGDCSRVCSSLGGDHNGLQIAKHKLPERESGRLLSAQSGERTKRVLWGCRECSDEGRPGYASFPGQYAPPDDQFGAGRSPKPQTVGCLRMNVASLVGGVCFVWGWGPVGTPVSGQCAPLDERFMAGTTNRRVSSDEHVPSCRGCLTCSYKP